ncbi:hypothetical protein NE237_001914 [Protea cynaroides]|uniref:Uncharacterized protein n=1 Tax=Protea cynaroides TaxID=273540 RepID=A0A9Q0KU03_9MAGN|nr:hypothetical protein NE237_001914 [Protea cynaroides]
MENMKNSDKALQHHAAKQRLFSIHALSPRAELQLAEELKLQMAVQKLHARFYSRSSACSGDWRSHGEPITGKIVICSAQACQHGLGGVGWVETFNSLSRDGTERPKQMDNMND